MTLPRLSANDMFDLGNGPTRQDPYIMGTGRVEVAAYTSEECFAEERELVGRVWLQIARVGEIPNPGDWVVRNVDIRSASVLIVFGKDSEVRAFHNICTHRGMALAWDDKRSGGCFVDPYHGWPFGSSGQLLNISAADCFAHVNKKESGLQPVSCETPEDFVFIDPDPRPEQSLKDFLGPLVDRITGLPFDQFTFGETVESIERANWKSGIEAHSESYHVPARHSSSFGKGMARGENPHMHYLSWEPTGVFGWRASSNLTKSDFWHHDQYMLFPNMVIVAVHSGWWLSSYWPITKNKSVRRAPYFYKTPTSQRQRFIIRQDAIRTRETFTEDSLALERQQAVLENGGMDILQMGENEILLRHLLAVISAATGQNSQDHVTSGAAE